MAPRLLTVRIRAIPKSRVLLRLTVKLNPATARTSPVHLRHLRRIKATAVRKVAPVNRARVVRRYRDESLAFSTCQVMFPRSPAA
jgi:hypothetical protein